MVGFKGMFLRVSQLCLGILAWKLEKLECKLKLLDIECKLIQTKVVKQEDKKTNYNNRWY